MVSLCLCWTNGEPSGSDIIILLRRLFGSSDGVLILWSIYFIFLIVSLFLVQPTILLYFKSKQVSIASILSLVLCISVFYTRFFDSCLLLF